MKLTVLGYSGAYPTKNSGTTSYLLESGDFHLLIDAGSYTFLELKKYLNPLDLDAAVITHYHHDHIADLGMIQYYRQLNRDMDTYEILPIYGNMEDPKHFEDLTFQDVTKGYGYAEGETLVIGPFNIKFLKVIHPVPTFALRITERETGKVLVFTADTGYLDKIISFTKDADVFLADTYFLNGNEKNGVHLTAGETGSIAKESGAKKVILTHLKENVDEDLLLAQTKEAYENDNVILARRDLVVEI